jgi:TetR/AcrR family transcriptional repressor of nem operon
MSTTPSRRELTHERIVEAAARTLRSKGYAGVGVADVMQQAGLTHGGFYAHFKSREALLAEAMERAGRDGVESVSKRIGQRVAKGQSPLRALIECYLSDRYLTEMDAGCVVAALGAEMHRQSAELLAPAAVRVNGLVGLVQKSLPAGGTHEQAMAITGAMVGSLQLARTLGANAEGKAMLAATREALVAQYDRP